MGKRDAANIPYDPKKSYYYKDEKGDFKECMLEIVDGGKATVMCGREKKVYKVEEIGQVNPRKFERCEDMADLTYLNDASVFHNLDVRFKSKPIYTARVVKMYLGKRRNEVPPHLWAITETAYRN